MRGWGGGEVDLSGSLHRSYVHSCAVHEFRLHSICIAFAPQVLADSFFRYDIKMEIKLYVLLTSVP